MDLNVNFSLFHCFLLCAMVLSPPVSVFFFFFLIFNFFSVCLLCRFMSKILVFPAALRASLQSGEVFIIKTEEQVRAGAETERGVGAE